MNTQEYDTSRSEAKKLYLSKFKSKKKLLVYEHEIFDFAYKCGFEAAEKDSEKGENTPARKFKSGDRVRYNGQVYEIGDYVGRNRYTLKGVLIDIDEDMLYPLSEPTNQSRKLSQDTDFCDKHSIRDQYDNLAQQGFKETNRLHIAAMIAQGILSCDLCQNPDTLAKSALQYADLLIAECEKGGNK